MGEIGKKAVLIVATVIVALMLIIPASGRISSKPSQVTAGSSAPILAAGAGLDRPERRRRIIFRRHRRHYNRVQWARWHRRERWERHHRS